MKTKILIIIRSGGIESIHSDKKLEVTIVDHDLDQPRVTRPHAELCYENELKELIESETK